MRMKSLRLRRGDGTHGTQGTNETNEAGSVGWPSVGLLCWLLYALTAAVVWDAGAAPAVRPNILFILTDDMGYGDVGCYGGKFAPTPNLDRLAREGIRFTQYYTSAPICSPARAGLTDRHFSGVVAGQRYQKIWDKACGGFFFEIDTSLGANNSELTIYRATTGGSGARWYIPTDTVLRAGHNYYIQIAWNTSAGPGNEPYPTVWIGVDGNAPVHQTHFDESGGALGGTGSWCNDSVGSANLGNTGSDAPGKASAKIDSLNGGFFVYRQFSSIVNFSNGGNWNTDKLRWT